MALRWGNHFVIGALFVLAACAHARVRPGRAPLQALPEPKRPQRLQPAPEWYWEPVDLDPRSAVAPLVLPIAEPSLVRAEGAKRVWDELGAPNRERLLHDGIVVTANGEARVKMGAFYTDLRELRVPYLVTLDALAYALHVAWERALAEVDDTLLAPGLDALLAQLETRLAAEQRGAGVELSEALALAQGMVAVARGLSSAAAVIPGGGGVPGTSASTRENVLAEIARVQAHAGAAVSPLLDVNVDYARFAAPEWAAHPGPYRALAWLAGAPLMFVAASEARGATAGVGTARLATRAAMVLSRLMLREVDPATHALWTRLRRVLTFVWGPSDDLSGPELAELATTIGVAIEDPKQISNVVTVDRLRKRAAQGRTALLFDGSGAPGRPGTALRVFGGHAAPDSLALMALGVGRPLPSVLDLPVWIGAREGRAALHESGFDGAPSYDALLAKAISARPSDTSPVRHASVHGSLVDVLMTWLAPDAPRSLASPAAQRAAIESALAAWTFARHDGEPLTRPLPSRAPLTLKPLEVRGGPLPAFVEEAPDVIAQLAAAAAQMRRGLAVVGGLPATSPALVGLTEVEDLLRLALRVAQQEVNGEALTPEDASALASVPARLARLEESTGALVPVVADLVFDAAGDRVLSTATGGVESAVVVVQEPGTDRLLLAVGAHIAQHELVEPRATRSTDASLRVRILRQDATAPPRAAYTAAFRARP